MWAHLGAGGRRAVPVAAWEVSRLSGGCGAGGRKWWGGDVQEGGAQGCWGGRRVGLWCLLPVTQLCRSPPVLSLACIAGPWKGLPIKTADTGDHKRQCRWRASSVSPVTWPWIRDAAQPASPRGASVLALSLRRGSRPSQRCTRTWSVTVS